MKKRKSRKYEKPRIRTNVGAIRCPNKEFRSWTNGSLLFSCSKERSLGECLERTKHAPPFSIVDALYGLSFSKGSPNVMPFSILISRESSSFVFEVEEIFHGTTFEATFESFAVQVFVIPSFFFLLVLFSIKSYVTRLDIGNLIKSKKKRIGNWWKLISRFHDGRCRTAKERSLFGKMNFSSPGLVSSSQLIN